MLFAVVTLAKRCQIACIIEPNITKNIGFHDDHCNHCAFHSMGLVQSVMHLMITEHAPRSKYQRTKRLLSLSRHLHSFRKELEVADRLSPLQRSNVRFHLQFLWEVKCYITRFAVVITLTLGRPAVLPKGRAFALCREYVPPKFAA